MAAAHNTFIQGLNAMVRHGPTVTEDKVEPFMWFCLALVRRRAPLLYLLLISSPFQLENIHHHHSLEETYLFPAMEEKLGAGALSANIEEHEEFVPKLEALDEWCKKVQEGEVVYDGKVFSEMVDGFADSMVAHMTNVSSISFRIHLLNVLVLITSIIGNQNLGP
jgi:Hemerythrin HHE cation binding domain